MTPATRSRLIIVTAGTGALVFFLHLFGALAGPEGALMRVLAVPETKLANAARSLRQFVGAPFRLNSVLSENESLKKENDVLLVRTASMGKLQEENDALRALISFAKRSPKAPIMAHVLAAEPDLGTHAILIDKGSNDGIGVDDPVVAGDGIIVGKVLETSETTSTVLLLTDTRSRIGATVGNVSKTQGIVQGENGLSLRMGLIPQNQDIAVGDLVVTSGIEPLVPEGLVIGRVSSVQAPERNPFKTAGLDSPVEYDRVDVVGVLIP